MSKMSKQEKNDFDELYQYVKKEVFEYDEQNLPRYMVLRLKGLHEGKFIANKNIKPMAHYEYKHILYTFKINKAKIKQIIKSDKFNNEKHKFNTIMMIIEGEINNVVNRLKQAKKSEEKIKNIDLENVNYEGAEYKNKSKNKKVNDELKKLW